MLSSWLNYCSSKQKEVAEKIFKRMDHTVRQLNTVSEESANQGTYSQRR